MTHLRTADRTASRGLQNLRGWAWRLSMRGWDRGPNITRYFMYRRLQEIGSNLAVRTGRVLAISHSEYLVDMLSIHPTELVVANYPDQDIRSLSYPDESFDFILSDQVLEHVAGDPQGAIDQCHRLLRPNGVALHTTCLLNPIHDAPEDYWRFTPFGLELLHQNYSRIIEVGGWGNWLALRSIHYGLRFVGVPHSKWHPYHRRALKNDPLWPISTWVVAQK